MKILVVGTEDRLTEFRGQAGSGHEVDYVNPELNSFFSVEGYNAIFDLNLDEEPARIELYAGISNRPVFAGSVKRSLASISAGHDISCVLFGINSLPGFLSLPQKEISLLNDYDRDTLTNTLDLLGWNYQIVADRTGMVVPRVLFMIINEACFLCGEGTASFADVDKGMKLGTNYPAGPFEWANRTGIRHVFETLQAIAQETGDPRYKIAPLLRSHYLKKEAFAI